MLFQYAVFVSAILYDFIKIAMGQTVPLENITDFPFANKTICQKEYKPHCRLLDTSGVALDTVNCTSAAYQFSKSKIPTSITYLKVVCSAASSKNSTKKASWYFYAETSKYCQTLETFSNIPVLSSSL